MERRSGAWARALKGAACVAALALFVRTLVQADLRKALGLVSEAGPAVLLVLVPYALTLGFDSAAFRALFAALGRLAPIRGLFPLRVASEAVSMSLPAGTVFGETVTPYLLKKWCGIGASDALAAQAARKWIQMRAHAFYIALSVAVGYGWLESWSYALLGHAGLPWLVLGSALVPLTLSAVMHETLSRGAAAGWVHALLAKVPIATFRLWLLRQRAGFEATDDRLERFGSAMQPQTILATALFVGAWCAEALDTFVILRVLGVHLGFFEVLSFEAGLSLLRSLAFFAPAGVGVQDLGYFAVFGAIGITDATAVGAAFVLLKRGKELVWVAVGYLLLLVTGVRRPRAISSSATARTNP